MYLSQLEYFRVLAKEPNYTHAAKKLYITQPSLSYAIRELEKEIGVPLFDRNSRKMRLSAAGEVFLSHVERALDELHEGISSIESMENLISGTVKVAYIYSFGQVLLPLIIRDFHQKLEQEKIEFKFISGVNKSVLDALSDGSADVAFCSCPPPNFGYLPVYKQELAVVLPLGHPLANASRISLSQLEPYDLILPNYNCGLRQHLDTLFEKAGIHPHVAFEAEDCSLIISFVSHNQGICIVPKAPLQKSGNYAVRDLEGDTYLCPVYVVWNPNRFANRAVDIFLDYIKNLVERKRLSQILKNNPGELSLTGAWEEK